MAKQITRITYRRLRRDEQFSFNDAVIDCIQRSGCDAGKPFAEFKAKSEALKAMRKKKLQRKSTGLYEKDAVVDKNWHAFYMQVHASQEHPYPEVADAANQIAKVFDKVKRPTALNYDREYGALLGLLDGLNGLDPALFTTALLAPHYDALSASVKDFVQTKQDQLAQEKNNDTITIDQAVAECSVAWTQLASYIEAKENADELGGNQSTIDLLNQFLGKLDVLIRGRDTRAKKKKANAEASDVEDESENLVEEALAEEAAEA